MASYQKKMNRRKGPEMFKACTLGTIRCASKTDAFLEGVGSLMDIFPDPRPRTIRAFRFSHSAPQIDTVRDAILADWSVIGQDMWTAIEAKTHEESNSTAEELANRLKALTAR